MPKQACPYCGYTRFYRLRRDKRRCKREGCRREYAPRRYPVPGIRSTEADWRRCARTFLRNRTIAEVVEATGFGHCRVERMLSELRRRMADEPLPVFSGTVEMDETYVGGQRKNQRLHIRRLYPPKRGHGTQKLPIVGVFHRGSGRVLVRIMPRKLDWRFILAMVYRHVAKGATVCTDGFPMYEPLSRMGYVHRTVDHNAGEWVRGRVHTNGIEGFWGFLKRRLSCIGGMRRDRLGDFVGEIAWRYNHRKESAEQKERALMRLVLDG